MCNKYITIISQVHNFLELEIKYCLAAIKTFSHLFNFNMTKKNTFNLVMFDCLYFHTRFFFLSRSDMENVCILTPITLPRSLFGRLGGPALLSKCLTNRVREEKSGNRVRPFSALIKTYVKRQS